MTIQIHGGGQCCPECGSNTCCGSIKCKFHDENEREQKMIEKARASEREIITEKLNRQWKLAYDLCEDRAYAKGKVDGMLEERELQYNRRKHGRCFAMALSARDTSVRAWQKRKKKKED